MSKVRTSKEATQRRNIHPFRLNRRAFLRSASAAGAGTIWLPSLEAMFNSNGDRYANGAEIAKRYIGYIWGVSYTSSKGKTWAPRTGTGPIPTNSTATNLTPMTPTKPN